MNCFPEFWESLKQIIESEEGVMGISDLWPLGRSTGDNLGPVTVM